MCCNLACARRNTLQDCDNPREPADPAKLTPEQSAHVQRRAGRILLGGAIRIVPPAVLLASGLTVGLLTAIPIYLMVRLACGRWRLWRKNETVSRKQLAELPAFLLGGASLATQNPLWFQLEIPILSVIFLLRGMVDRKPIFADTDLPLQAEIVGDGPSRLLKALLLSGFLLPAVLLWLAFHASPTPWLLVRTLAVPLGLVAFSLLGTWFATRHAAKMAG